MEWYGLNGVSSLSSLFFDLAEFLPFKFEWPTIMLNTDFDEKVDIVKGDLEEILHQKNFISNLLQLCQLLETFYQTLF